MGEIVVGYDGSASADAALDKAAELSKALGERVIIAFGYAPRGYGGGEVPSQRDAVRELGEAKTAKGKERADAAGVDSEVVMVAKHGAHALVDIAEERGADLIVVGSRGEAPLKGVIVGSTPHKLLQMSTVPVLVVPGAD
jgi:nucleotide-binding universal stress UspA family protein